MTIDATKLKGLDAVEVGNIPDNQGIYGSRPEEAQPETPSPEAAKGVCTYDCKQMRGINRFGGGAQSIGQEFPFPLPDKQTTLMLLDMALIMVDQRNIDIAVNGIKSFLDMAGVRNYPEIPRDPEAIRSLIGQLRTIVAETNTPAEGMRRLAAEAPGIIADLQNQTVTQTPKKVDEPVAPQAEEEPQRVEQPVEEVVAPIDTNERFGITEAEEARFIANMDELGGTYGLFNQPRIPSMQERQESAAIHKKLKEAAESGYVDPDVAEAYQRNKAQMEVNFGLARTYKGHTDAPTKLPDDPAQGIIVLYNYFMNHINDEA